MAEHTNLEDTHLLQTHIVARSVGQANMVGGGTIAPNHKDQ